MRRMFKLATMVVGFSSLCASALAEVIPIPQQSPEFAVKLYRKLASEKGNLFFSPISIQSALSMTAEGAKGNTQKQMLDVLSVGDLGEFSRSLKTISDPGEAKADGVQPMQLSIVNGIFPQQAYPLREEFTRIATQRYNAQAEALDYQDPEKARSHINGWVEKYTAGKIKDLIPAGVLQTDTRLVLANAIYFKAQWAEQFSENATSKGGFLVTPDKQVGVGMMHQTARYGHAETDAYHMVSLAYAGHTASMVLVVPKAKDGFAKVEEGLDPKSFGEQLKLTRTQARKIRLTMPSFKITHSAALAEPLKALGMTDAFSDKADFSGMTTAEKLCISAVLHQAVVDVDEKGTEAAAATAVIMGVMSAPIEEEPPLEIIADHPFLFLIVDQRTGAVLFMGRLVDPNA